MAFNCRDCPKNIREHCIQECSTSPSVKLMMLRAFEAGTDTQQMWGWLQEDCLLLRPEKQAARPSRPSVLARRLRGEPEPVEATREIEEVAPPVATPVVSDELLQPKPEVVREPTIRSTPAWLREVEKREEITPSRYCLALQGGQRRIALPTHGEIVLGRFDPAVNVTPDVDLSYEDRNNRVISRRHARIIGRNGRHLIEDVGSTNGTKINGKALRIGQKVQLRPGDRVILGYSEFVYVPMPEAPVSPHGVPPKAYVLVAFTGRRFPMPSRGEVMIGRSDPVVGFTPDIDLREEGEAAQVVARRHAKIIARGGRHYLEDMGSTNGTKLNGVRIRIGGTSPLNPGDHLWLGGCVLAYDIEHQSD